MLSKLLRHEINATARLLVPLYLILLFLSIVDRIVLRLTIFNGVLQVIPGIFTFMYVMTIITIIIVTVLLMIMRFYKNLLSDEGYLMFTLPVKTHQIITSKLLVAVFWAIVSFLAVFISIFFVAAEPNSLLNLWTHMKSSLGAIRAEFGSNYIVFTVEMLAMALLGLIYFILNVYTAIAVGQLFHNHKIIGSVGAYIGINTAVQTIATIIIMMLGYFVHISMNDINAIPEFILPMFLLFLLVFNIIFYSVTKYLFQKKLNLE